MTDRLLNNKEVIAFVGLGMSTLHKWRKAGKFPKGIKINGLRKCWESEVLAYIESETNRKKTLLTAPKPSPPRKRLTKHVKPTAKPERRRLAKHIKPKDRSK